MDPKQRLDQALRQRERLMVEVERIKAQRSAAIKAKAEVEEESKERGIPPDQIPQALAQIQKKFEDSIRAIETQNQAAREALQPFLQRGH